MKQINGEPVKLVESFDELRPGMAAWTIGCPYCSARHRRILLSGPKVEECAFPGEPNELLRLFEVAPARQCMGHYSRDALTERSVELRKVYRVIDEQLDADTTGERTTRELERVD